MTDTYHFAVHNKIGSNKRAFGAGATEKDAARDAFGKLTEILVGGYLVDMSDPRVTLISASEEAGILGGKGGHCFVIDVVQRGMEKKTVRSEVWMHRGKLISEGSL